ncbi:50S ribosomal protein L11 methyltransferase [Anaerofustis stercorihominis]|uniref:Ribosomal protein L11 methyltransferase n=2 Tax=Anaerofustis stercorihominis TaxID=214853 RepID=B1C7G5_9FIRM|nr:50S ribosomal protein L11 methyltransferase [Anaerofustis stercorihominis]EDS72952.1 ribosomal protein L11 methyltransferase [Anaerofustis stercorihominis DSM 17244]MCQ4794323.1 50S ribosomal protein L11 methyltransferase [Anaerofustis stercorihominis]RGD74256.1 50S ribosomal protein L11 methyltransferase [Anaerofustis stercorihominis]
MNYNEISIYTKSEGIDILTNALTEIGIDSFLIEDKADFENFLTDNRETWDLVDEDLMKKKDTPTNVKVYILEDENQNEVITKLKDKLNILKAADSEDILGSLDLGFNDIKEEDWANNWKKYFKPSKVGEKLVVKPTWEDYDNNEDRIILEIDPGASFGTGTHETTRLCLMGLEKYIKGGEDVIDVGCGSGILSIAAVKLGSSHVTGVDIDPMCIETSSYLSKINHVEDKFDVFIGDLAEKVDIKADIIVANIFAHIIKRLTPDTNRILKKGGIFISSGIIEETVDTVVESYKENNFEILEVNNMGEWYSVVGKRL